MSQYDKVSQQQTEKKDPLLLQLMFVFMYFMQNAIYIISPTMPFIYTKLPSYGQLSIFYSALIPWCLKFLVSPFLEKYTDMEYGKRKTWLLISKLIVGLILIVASFHTDYSDATLLAWMLVAANFFVMFHVISSESLSIKHFVNKERIGLYQVIGQHCGLAFGSLFLMKMTSFQFAQGLGLDKPITSASNVFIIYAVLLLLSILPIHFFFDQNHLGCEQVSNAKDLCTIIGYNRVFFDSSSKFFRIVLFLLAYHQFMNIYNAGIEYALIGNGFSRDVYNTMLNCSLIINAFLVYAIEGVHIQRNVFFFVSTLLDMSVMLLMAHFLPSSIWINSFVLFLTQFTYAWRKLVIFEMMNTLPLHGVAGMFLTTLTSCSLFGEVRTVHSWLIDAFGFIPCLHYGALFQIIFLAFVPKIFEWIDAGTLNIDKELLDQPDDMQQQ